MALDTSAEDLSKREADLRYRIDELVPKVIIPTYHDSNHTGFFGKSNGNGSNYERYYQKRAEEYLRPFGYG